MMTPAALCALIGTAVILTLVAPYDTGQLLGLVARFAYWLVTVVSTYSAGFLAHALLAPRLPLPKPAAIAIKAVVTAIAVAALVTLINLVFLGYWPSRAEWPLFLINILVIALVVAVIIEVASTQRRDAPHDLTTAPPALLDRIAFGKRAPLMALSVEDHYVRIRTTKGQEMILMRLSDAMREVGATQGLQVHRSHWVALAGVARTRRQGDRAILTLHDGTEIPVSRRYVAAIKEAGLLPR